MCITFRKSKGFTLLEVIIAIAIFSMISLTSFNIFDTVLRSDEVSKERTARLNELQRAFVIIERDLMQIAQRSVRIDGEAPLKTFLRGKNNDSPNEEADLSFVRNGWTNPGLLMPRSNMQSVAYKLNEEDEILERQHYNFVDPVLGENAKVRALITGAIKVDFEYFYKQTWQKELRNDSLPLAIAIELELNDFGVIRRQFLVPSSGGSGS